MDNDDDDDDDDDEYSLTISTIGQGKVKKDPNKKEYDEGTVVTLTADPSKGWEFTRWSGDASGTSRTIEVTMDDDKDITATFTEVTEVSEQYSLTVKTSGQGSVIKDPNKKEYDEGTVVTLTANPADGWEFTRWSGDASGTSRTIEVTMDDDKDITAIFTEVTEVSEQYSLTVKTSGQGSVIKDPNKKEYDEGTVVTLTANPADGWEFTRWSGDASGTSRTIQVTMDDDKDITATFSQTINSPPAATDVEITGTLSVCKVLTATYEYADPEGNTEEGTVITWFRADDDSGTNLQEIHMGRSYTLSPEDEDKYVMVRVTPGASSGATPGDPVNSALYGPVVNDFPTASLSGPVEFCAGSSASL
ncbi:MAG: InlB B-repeat-containing protein, partial [Bacteroidales bacterium]|nr:InlB B-repeat-containing protein [Bacteroidales bacterium]